jgi:hypothetical protein
MRERAPRRDVDRISAHLLHPAAYLDGLLEAVSSLEPEEKGVCLLADADLHLQVGVAADALSHGAHGLEQQPHAGLEHSAVLVVAVVDVTARRGATRLPVEWDSRSPRSALWRWTKARGALLRW